MVQPDGVVERQQAVVDAGVVGTVEPFERLRRQQLVGQVTAQQPQHGHVGLSERVAREPRRLLVLCRTASPASNFIIAR